MYECMLLCIYVHDHLEIVLGIVYQIVRKTCAIDGLDQNYVRKSNKEQSDNKQEFLYKRE